MEQYRLWRQAILLFGRLFSRAMKGHLGTKGGNYADTFEKEAHADLEHFREGTKG